MNTPKHVHYHFCGPSPERLDAIEHQLHHLKELIMTGFADLQREVAETNAAVDLAVSGIVDLKQQIVDLKAQVANGLAVDDALEQLALSLDATQTRIQTALNAGDAPAPAPAPAEPPAADPVDPAPVDPAPADPVVDPAAPVADAPADGTVQPGA